MKRIFLAAFFATISCTIKAQTTTQEYNYSRNGFLKDWSEGRTFPGYKAEEFSKDNNDGIEMYLLNDATSGITKSCIMAVSSQFVRKFAIVIPIGLDFESKLWETTFQDIYQVSIRDRKLMENVSHYMGMAISEAIGECDKQSIELKQLHETSITLDKELKQIQEANSSLQRQLTDVLAQQKTTLAELEKQLAEVKQLKDSNNLLQKQLSEMTSSKTATGNKNRP